MTHIALLVFTWFVVRFVIIGFCLLLMSLLSRVLFLSSHTLLPLLLFASEQMERKRRRASKQPNMKKASSRETHTHADGYSGARRKKIIRRETSPPCRNLLQSFLFLFFLFFFFLRNILFEVLVGCSLNAYLFHMESFVTSCRGATISTLSSRLRKSLATTKEKNKKTK